MLHILQTIALVFLSVAVCSFTLIFVFGSVMIGSEKGFNPINSLALTTLFSILVFSIISSIISFQKNQIQHTLIFGVLGVLWAVLLTVFFRSLI